MTSPFNWTLVVGPESIQSPWFMAEVLPFDHATLLKPFNYCLLRLMTWTYSQQACFNRVGYIRAKTGYDQRDAESIHLTSPYRCGSERDIYFLLVAPRPRSNSIILAWWKKPHGCWGCLGEPSDHWPGLSRDIYRPFSALYYSRNRP